MFRNKETLLDCEGETQPLTLPLHPAMARPLLSATSPDRALCMSVLHPLPIPAYSPPVPSLPPLSGGADVLESR